jgi:hypothetical protein
LALIHPPLVAFSGPSGSLLKEHTASEKEKAAVKREQLDEVEHLLAQQRAAIVLLNTNADKLMAGAKELYTTAEAHGETNIKMREDINKQAIVIAHREQAVLEKEEEIIGMLDHERSKLSSRETILNTCEVTLEEDQKRLADMRTEVLACELAANLKVNHLAFRERELADREKQLPAMLPQELVATQKRLEELQAARAVKA